VQINIVEMEELISSNAESVPDNLQTQGNSD
jgi:hypothetical protein